MEGLVKLAADDAQKKKNEEVHEYLKQNYPEDCLEWAKDCDWKDKTVSLAKIQMARRPGGAREMDKVKGIAEAVKQGKPMERVVLVKTPDGKVKIADGYHRTLGHDHAGKKTIEAVIAEVKEHKGPWDKEMHEKKLNKGPQPQLDKEASLLAGLGIAGAMHVAPNLAMKAVKSTKAGQSALAGTFSAGIDAGRNGMKLHPNFQHFMEYGVGPESLVDYHLGRKIGQRIAQVPPERQERFINKAKGMAQAHMNSFANPEEVEKTPMLNSIKHYIDGKGENKVKTAFGKMSVPETAQANWKNHLGDAAMLGGAYVANPHLLLQPAFSGARKVLSKSQMGQKVFVNNFEKGHNGNQISKPKELATDLLVSPAVLDSYRIGNSMNRNLSEKANQSFKQNVDMNQVYQKAFRGGA
jgi:hypothetical protein